MSKTFIKRPLCFVLSLLMIVGLYPFSILNAGSAVPTPFSAMGETKIADPSTMNDWVNYFNSSSTEYAGAVWTDKSVFTDASAFTSNGISLKNNDDFLIALSAMASNMTIAGMEYAPTDTVFVLDVSGSMVNNNAVGDMVNAANISIKKLLDSGKHNRISVITFSADTATTLLPLGRYTSTNDTYLSTNRDEDRISVSDTAYIEGTQNKPTSRRVNVTGATYTQSGIIKAIDTFLAEENNITVTDPQLGELSRIPVFVLMSDGAPTRGTTNFENPGSYEFGDGSNPTSALGFVTQLSLAHAKYKLSETYKTDTALLYTIGLGVSDSEIAQSVLDPSKSTVAINDLWTSYNNAAVNSKITVHTEIEEGFFPWDDDEIINYNVTKTSTPLNKNYVDKYIEVDGTNDNALLNAFDEIVNQIQLKSKFYPTHVEDDENLSGYVSFVDKLGKYMEVKDVKGLLINNVLHTGETFAKHLIEHHADGNLSLDPNDVCYAFIDSVEKRLGIDESTALSLVALAISNGQLAYNATANTFSNYIGWFSDDYGKFVGFWHEGIANIPEKATYINRSYGFFGDTNTSLNISAHDMLYATVRVREEISTGFESVAFAVPAALIPTLTYNVSLNENGDPTNITLTGDRSPIRLVYEAGLEDEINEVTVKSLVTDAEYLSAHFDDKTGVYEFYTNRFDHGTGVTAYGTNNTYAYFTPSFENERYYYLSDSPIYSDTNGTLYSGGTPDPNGTYYRAVTVYKNNGGSFSKETVYEQIMPYALSSSSNLVQKGENWYVKAGTAHNYVEGREVVKQSNYTESIDFSYHPFVDAQHSYVVGAVLGNNGRLLLTPATGIKVTKTVKEANTETGAPTSFNFTVTNNTNTADNTTYKTYHVTASGVVTEGVITFAGGKASFSIKDGEKFYITGITAGDSFTVSEEETAYYFCAQNDINLTAVSQSLVTADFVNTARGKGDLTIAKVVEHDFGTSYEIPADKIFNFEVTLEGIGVIGSTFVAEHSGDATIKAVTVGADGKITFSLKHNEEFEIFGLPEGTKVKVVEKDPDSGFTPNYYENNVLGDGELSIQKDIIDVIRVVNDYAPTKVDPVNITVSGTKTLERRAWKAEDEFTFVLQKLNSDGTTWTELSTTSVKGTDASKTFTFTDVFANATYDKAGIYYYRITETEGSELGMNYDRTVHAFAVIVGDANMDGKLEITEVRPERETVTVAFSGGSWNVTANFNNVYDLKETTASIDITKLVTNESGSPLALLSSYTFELYEGDTYITTSEPTTDRGFTRLNLTFNAVGEHTYTLKEVIPASVPTGWTYDRKEVTIEVNVTANEQEGTLIATFADTKTNTTAVTFTNIYNPTPATLDIDVRKSLSGRPLNDGEFSFTIVDADGNFNNYTETVKNTASGDVPFSTLTFTKVGNYKFKVSEIKGDLGGVTYDQNTYIVAVTVSDNNGVLTASYVVESTAHNYVIFNNTYTAESVKHTISGLKVLEGRKLLNAEFKFTLAESDASGNIVAGGKTYTVENLLDGSFSFPEIEYTKTGDYYYVVTEVNDSAIPGITYDTTKYIVKITVKDELNGKLSVETPVIHIDGNGAVDAIKFINKYTPAPTSADITGDKIYETMINGEIVGKEFGANAFSFSIYESNAEWAENGKLIETVSNDASGSFSFKALNFTEAGEYYYIVKELHGGQTINGVVYDDAVFKIRIEVKDDGNGKLYTVIHKADKFGLPVETIEFKNNYVITASAEITITGIKILQNKDLAADMFEFALYTADENQNITDSTPVEVVKNNASGEFTFSKLIFDGKDGHRGAGTYYYIIKEISGSLAGITYDTKQYFVKITVTDTDSILTATATGADNIVFTNTYSAEPVEVTIGATKELTGKTLAEGEFSFVIAEVGGSYTETVKNAADGSISFSKLTFDKVGTYTYTISEVIGFAGGIKYDDTKYTVTIEVTDKGEGKLFAEIKGGEGIIFKNSYNTANTEVRFSGTKLLLGRNLVAGEFEFILKGSGVNQTVKVNADGSFVFDAISYDKTGRYEYTIEEIDGGIAGVTYDKTVYEITVEVKDNGEGKLVADVTGSDSITFTNKYKATAAEIIFSGKKELTGRPLKAGEFNFTLFDTKTNTIIETVTNDANGNFVFHTVKYETAGTYNYTISEVKGNLGGVTYDDKGYDITVEVKDNGEGKLVATIENPTPVVFNNTYSTDKTSVQIGGNKVLTGRNLTAGEFNFTITGNGINETATNDANGNFSFPAIEYTSAGTYTYTVSEVNGSLPGITYDKTVYTVTVTVIDNEDGKLVATPSISQSELVFTNAYTAAPGTVTFAGTKNLTGKPLSAGEFGFILTDDNGNTVTVTNNSDGSFSFPTITYTEVGVYTYIIEEVIGTRTEISYDTNVYNITVTVIDENGVLKCTKSITDSTGEETNNIVFNNKYNITPTSVQISGTKILEGRDLKANEFSFVLTDVTDPNNTKIIETVKNSANGKFHFSAIEHADVGTFKYTIHEIKGKLGGVTYDTTVYTITVTITDNGDGTLSKDVKASYVPNPSSTLSRDISINSIKFKNKYESTNASLKLSARKTLVGRELKNGEFTFELRHLLGNQVIYTTTNDANGLIVFPEIVYTRPGSHYYVVTEVNNSINGITYDKSEFLVFVTVSDNGNGKLVALTTIPEFIEFTNYYNPLPANIQIQANKILNGRTLVDSEFSFELKDSDGNVIETVKNSADGSINFSEIEFTSAGTYTYTVSEVLGNAGGINYDSTVYDITVTVTDNGNGKLVATVEGADNIVFTNRYMASSASAIFSGTKILEGKNLTEGAYSFELKDADGNVIETVKNAADGTINFSEIEYTSTGTYTYTINEVLGNDASILYDATVYPVKVTVTDNGNGKLIADVESDNIVFTNRVIAPAEVTFEGINYLDLVLAGGFNFVMKDGENVITNATSDANGYFNLGTLVYDSEGTYTYSISEIAGNDENIIYDTNVFTVTVTVTLEGAEYKANVKVDALIPLESAKIRRSSVTTTGIEFYNWTIPEETTVPEETTGTPEETTSPEETTGTPEETTSPEETTDTPEETTSPEETTEAPEVTTSPEETTEAPEVTTSPEETTEAPEVTTSPEETTEVPEVTTSPEDTTEVPEVTTSPEGTTEAPEVTTSPEETTEAPETTDDPEDTETPNPSTGSSNKVIIWFGAAIVAFCATAGALFSKKREVESDNE